MYKTKLYEAISQNTRGLTENQISECLENAQETMSQVHYNDLVKSKANTRPSK